MVMRLNKKAAKFRPATFTKALIYIRVSTQAQAASGLSLEAQRESCRALAKLKGLKVVGEFEDAGISGTKHNRPALDRCLAQYAREVRKSAEERDGGTAILVYSLSRLGRSAQHLHQLLDDGVQIMSVTESLDTTTAAGRLVAAVLAAVAQMEAEMTAERTSTALQARIRKGLNQGREPYGTRMILELDVKAGRAEPHELGRLVEVPEERLVVDRIMERVGRGFKAEAIARWLNDNGYKARPMRANTPGTWHGSLVRRIIRREFEERPDHYRARGITYTWGTQEEIFNQMLNAREDDPRRSPDLVTDDTWNLNAEETADFVAIMEKPAEANPALVEAIRAARARDTVAELIADPTTVFVSDFNEPDPITDIVDERTDLA